MGDPDCLEGVACCHWYGLWVKKDDAKALVYEERAAEAVYVNSYPELGSIAQSHNAEIQLVT